MKIAKILWSIIAIPAIGLICLHQDQNEVADAPKEKPRTFAKRCHTLLFWLIVAGSGIVPVADLASSDPDVVAMGSISSVADCEREVAAPQRLKTSNTPNTQNTQLAEEDTDFAQYLRQRRLWRIEPQWKILAAPPLHRGKDTPKEWRRLDRTGGKSLPIGNRLNAGPGTGRHGANQLPPERLPLPRSRYRRLRPSLELGLGRRLANTPNFKHPWLTGELWGFPIAQMRFLDGILDVLCADDMVKYKWPLAAAQCHRGRTSIRIKEIDRMILPHLLG